MLRVLLGLLALVVAVPAFGQTDAELEAFVDLLRSDLRTEKAELITEYMDLSEAEAKAFWPIYRKYEREVRKINDARVKLIKEYGEYYFDMSDGRARDLAKRSIELEIKRDYVRREYFRQFDHALPTKTAVKFMQLDRHLGLLVDIQIASELPFIE